MARCVRLCVTEVVSVRNGCIVTKRCEIGERLLLITNGKSHTPFQMRSKSSTLDDLKGQYCNRNSNFIGCRASSPASSGLLVIGRFGTQCI